MPSALTRRSLLISVTAASAAAVLAGCSDDKEGQDRPSRSGSLEQTSLTVGGMPIIDDAPLYYAIRKGLFEKEGLKVRTETIVGGAAGIPRLGKDLDITFGNYVSFIQAHAGGLKLRVLSDGYQATASTFALMVGPKSPLRSPADVKGRKVAVNVRGNIMQLVALSLLSTHGVSGKDVTFVEVPFPEMGKAVKSGKVDAAVMAEPFITGAQREFGAEQLGDVISGPTENLPIAGYCAPVQWVKEHPNTAAAFSRAMRQAHAKCADRRRVTTLLPTYTKIGKEDAAIVRVGTYPTTISRTRIQRVSDLMQRFDLLKDRFDVSAMLG